MPRKKRESQAGADFATEELPASVDSHPELPPLPKERVSFAPIGMLTIFLSLTTLVFLLFSNFSDENTFTPEQKAVIPTEIKLSAKQFLDFSNSNVYMTVVKGTLSIGLDDQETHEYRAGTLLNIPKDIKMNVTNLHEEQLELIVVKAPAPEKQ